MTYVDAWNEGHGRLGDGLEASGVKKLFLLLSASRVLSGLLVAGGAVLLLYRAPSAMLSLFLVGDRVGVGVDSGCIVVDVLMECMRKLCCYKVWGKTAIVFVVRTGYREKS